MWYCVTLDGEDMFELSKDWPQSALLLALVRKYEHQEETPAPVVSALRRYKAKRDSKKINPKLPYAPLPCELIQINSWTEEAGLDYVVVTVVASHPDGSCWRQTLRSPYYSNREWETLRFFILKRQISEAELSRLRQIARKEGGPFEIKMVPYNHHGWRGRSK
jgi:hypothetical protein